MKAIMYHYVRPSCPEYPYFRNLHLDDFIQQLDFFEKNFNLITKEQFRHSLDSGEPVENGIVLTFDDGFKDHYQYVLPEFQKRNLWGTFYIPTAPYTNGKLIDVHRIHLLVGRFGGKKIFQTLQTIIDDRMLSQCEIKKFAETTYKTQNNDEYTEAVKKTLNYYISYDYRERVIDELMEVYYPQESQMIDQFYMTASEIRFMHDAGMLIGSHSVNHPVMSRLSMEDQQREIKDSFDFLESIVGFAELKTFCYPYGGFYSFTNKTEELLEAHNCVFTYNVESRDISSEDLVNSRQALPRYNCNLFPYGQCRDIPMEPSEAIKISSV